MLEDKSKTMMGHQQPVSLVSDQKHCLCVVIKWERNREKRQKEREKSSLYVRYNKKGSSNWGLKPPVVRSVHFSNRGGTHCLLCAQRMAHTKNTHQGGDEPKRTHFNTKMQHYFFVDESQTHNSSCNNQSYLQRCHIHKSVETTSHRSKINAGGLTFAANCKARLLWYKVTADSFQLLDHSLTNSGCWITCMQTWKVAQRINNLTTGETHPVQRGSEKKPYAERRYKSENTRKRKKCDFLSWAMKFADSSFIDDYEFCQLCKTGNNNQVLWC